MGPGTRWHSGRSVHLATVGTEEGQIRGPGRPEEATAESWATWGELQLMGYKAYSVCVQIVFCAAYTRRFVRSEFSLSSHEAHFC